MPKELKKADLTAKWWVIQEEIIQNQSEPTKLILNVLETISTVISKDYDKLDYTGNNEGKNIEEFGKCPLCGKKVFESKISYFTKTIPSVILQFGKKIKLQTQKFQKVRQKIY